MLQCLDCFQPKEPTKKYNKYLGASNISNKTMNFFYDDDQYSLYFSKGLVIYNSTLGVWSNSE